MPAADTVLDLSWDSFTPLPLTIWLADRSASSPMRMTSRKELMPLDWMCTITVSSRPMPTTAQAVRKNCPAPSRMPMVSAQNM